MIFTSYTAREPFASAWRKDWNALSVDDQIDIEDAVQRWQPSGPETGHVYADIDGRKCILARKVRSVRRFVIAVYDNVLKEIEVVSIAPGGIQKVVVAAFDFAGVPRHALSAKASWTG